MSSHIIFNMHSAKCMPPITRTVPSTRSPSVPSLNSSPCSPVQQATKAFLRSVGKYAGVALQNETFTKALFDFTLVPGKAWSTAELREAAPIKLKTL